MFMENNQHYEEIHSSLEELNTELEKMTSL